MPLFFAGNNTLQKGEFDVTVFDVGQGLASVIHTSNHVLLYDTGPKYSPSFTAGRAIIVPYLRYLGNDRVDIIVQSHGDNDHIGGLTDVMEDIEIGKIFNQCAK